MAAPFGSGPPASRLSFAAPAPAGPGSRARRRRQSRAKIGLSDDRRERQAEIQSAEEPVALECLHESPPAGTRSGSVGAPSAPEQDGDDDRSVPTTLAIGAPEGLRARTVDVGDRRGEHQAAVEVEAGTISRTSPTTTAIEKATIEAIAMTRQRDRAASPDQGRLEPGPTWATRRRDAGEEKVAKQRFAAMTIAATICPPDLLIATAGLREPRRRAFRAARAARRGPPQSQQEPEAPAPKARRRSDRCPREPHRALTLTSAEQDAVVAIAAP